MIEIATGSRLPENLFGEQVGVQARYWRFSE